MANRRYKDEQWLREQYCEEKKSIREIAGLCDCSYQTVSRWLDNHGIETRYTSSAQISRLKDHQWLRKQYCEKQKSSYKIAELCNCSRKTVCRWLDNHGIETRGMSSAPDSRLKDEQWLREQYCGEEKSTIEIAKLCDCCRATVFNWLKRHGIEMRSIDGQNNPNWNGGRFPYGPGWNGTKRRKVRQRDGFECVRCGMSQSEHKTEYGQKLHVHHLKKARDIDDPEERNAVDNLITLCRGCHSEYEQFASVLQPQLVAD